jgi:hypothetical protein
VWGRRRSCRLCGVIGGEGVEGRHKLLDVRLGGHKGGGLDEIDEAWDQCTVLYICKRIIHLYRFARIQI